MRAQRAEPARSLALTFLRVRTRAVPCANVSTPNPARPLSDRLLRRLLRMRPRRHPTMSRSHIRELPGEDRRQLVYDVDRPMLAPGTAYGHREIAAVARLVFRYAGANE